MCIRDSFEIGGKKIYHAGDTGLIADFSLLREEKLDAALLPIGDFYTICLLYTSRCV